MVQEFSNSTGLHRSRSSTRYSGNGVVQGYRSTVIVQMYIGTGVEQVYTGIGVMQRYRVAGLVQIYMGISIVHVCRVTGVSREFRSTIGVQRYMSETAGFHVYYRVQLSSSCTWVQGYRCSTGVHGVHEMYSGTAVMQGYRGIGVLDDYRVEQGYRRSAGLHGTRNSTGEQGCRSCTWLVKWYRGCKVVPGYYRFHG
jgi:hypothetical protein